ncbi:head-tail adaptor protein [Mesobaculum littorinae]|uniref:Head-tail adaptor protein n=1 Tax=Mesobaculum littorinae TaxID=2486419 RepID=A0A438AK22_9RHOB|nr:head-tail adaptor protein [Mesobaculum littorinae]RVV98999.1 head-tail adaptor protein [Mesobaculum littorinae]
MSLTLTRKLVLEERRRSPDGAGGHKESWIALGAHWGELRLATARDQAGLAAPGALTRWRITLRAMPPGAPSRPRPGQRFCLGARVFAIRAVAEVEPEARFLMCVAEEEISA